MVQGQKDLNPRHLVLETNALPTELYPYIKPPDRTYGQAVKKLRGKDLNQRPSGYEPDELPDCSIPR